MVLARERGGVSNKSKNDISGVVAKGENRWGASQSCRIIRRPRKRSYAAGGLKEKRKIAAANGSAGKTVTNG